MGMLFDYLKEIAVTKNIYDYNSENYQLVNEVRQTIKELKDAEIYFQNVTDPDLVDYAIYRLESLKRKYIYLLKKAKEEGINFDNFSSLLS
ncbi:MAG: Uncharacterized protein XD65_0381 [Caldanaerobacter subterraneus]|jgi:histidinol phosphatase-like enzyme|uniref:Uncharacterized protein n=2 Tax=Thermoanaerobacter TaxID=1754 RepID=B0K7Z6_THEP3|nr:MULTISPECIES: DUF2508 family protein [Thermoanaerobacter]KUJ90603.1 MAG: hypothetical protein XD37_1216 [Thermoanaerobacter thermocopriae]KUK35292.1 MAG: Uncharacterized protein XD65_0381 [Caldanaerobacter subterraneus]ABY91362.1 hypothetical protein Teth514_0039 [Thermoanaerobacter sp. X514]ABY95816.1 hypothetical protein Teth39_2194 [Thermoanaerobacter pseudethanolicus ATCC 33223]ADV80745.1 hypothetical protein Thebr_2240 [Thermoanaerobacter brockii subsp. finnii Ako-1]